MIELTNVSVSFDGQMVLDGVNFSLKSGEFVYLVGPTGAGKSSLLRLLYMDLKPDAGRVKVAGFASTSVKAREIPYLRRRLGVVFQDFKLLPNRTVLENVALTLEVLGWGKKDIGKKVYHILKQMGLEHKINSTPLRLSGGEQQRVALARALVNDPKVILADEPTGNLDDESKSLILNILKEANIRGTTVVVASHDKRLIDNCHRRVIMLDRGHITEDTDVPK